MIFFVPSRDEYLLALPEGGPGYTLYTAYSGVVLVAGGSGISYATGVLEDILQKHAAGRSNVRVIEVVWSVADPGKRKLPSAMSRVTAFELTTDGCNHLPFRLPLFAPSRAHVTHAAARISACRALAPLLRTLDPHLRFRRAHAAHRAAPWHTPSCGPAQRPRHVEESDHWRARRVFIDTTRSRRQLRIAKRHRRRLVWSNFTYGRRREGDHPCELGGLERRGRRREHRRVSFGHGTRPCA